MENTRIYKFRAYDSKDEMMYYNIQNGIDFEDKSHYEFKRFLGQQEIDDCHKWSVMQYTGLKDKNGVEIYEGDILKHDVWGNSEIIWEHERFRGKGKENYNGYGVTLAYHQLQRSRVIGNIYENPEFIVAGAQMT